LLTGSAAIAAIPNGNTISACRSNSTGALRVIDTAAGQHCNSGESALKWSNWRWRGPSHSTIAYRAFDVVRYVGSSYLARSAAPVGTAPTTTSYWSLIAMRGTLGPRGLPGVQGLTGPQGPVGPVGPIGPRGLIGAAGLDGAVGPIGPVGPQG